MLYFSIATQKACMEDICPAGFGADISQYACTDYSNDCILRNTIMLPFSSPV